VRRRCRPPARRRGAFYAWSHRPLAERIACVQRFAALLEAQKEALATLISRETSKPLWETRTEVQAMIGKAGISMSLQRAYRPARNGDAGR
jgi:succinylglutamic semialdehyde dehydrogenase